MYDLIKNYLCLQRVINMPETRIEAENRAERLGFPKSSVYCLEKDDKCFIVPYGITTAAGKKAYAEARAEGNSKEYSAKIAHTVDSKAQK